MATASTLERQLLLPFWAPSAYRQPQIIQNRAGAISQHCTRPSPWQSRSFSTTTITRQQEEAAPQPQPPLQPRPWTPTAGDEISRILDDTLDFDKGVPTAPTGRTSHSPSASAQHTNPPSRGLFGALTSSYAPPPGNSVGDLLNAFAGPSSDRSVESRLDPAGRNRAPSRRVGPGGVPLVPEKPLPMRLNASVGRTVRVDAQRGMDTARAFRVLEMNCAKNNVRRDLGRQRFYERPGLKRKRLRSERWKRRFREGFKGVVGLVMRMKRQGW